MRPIRSTIQNVIPAFAGMTILLDLGPLCLCASVVQILIQYPPSLETPGPEKCNKPCQPRAVQHMATVFPVR